MLKNHSSGCPSTNKTGRICYIGLKTSSQWDWAQYRPLLNSRNILVMVQRLLYSPLENYTKIHTTLFGLDYGGAWRPAAVNYNTPPCCFFAIRGYLHVPGTAMKSAYDAY